MTTAPVPSRRRRWPLILLAALLVLLAAGALAYRALPGLVLDRFHRVSARMGESYAGRAGGIDVDLFARRYVLRDVIVQRRDDVAHPPLAEVKSVEVTIDPFERASVVRVDGARIHLIAADGAARQFGEGIAWRHFLDELAPAAPVQRVEFRNVAVDFHEAQRPALVVTLDALKGAFSSLTTAPSATTPLPAHVDADGLLLAHAPIAFALDFDPIGPLDGMRLRARAREVDLPRLNQFARVWARIDFAGGEGELALRADYSPTRVQGAAQVDLENVDVFDWRQDVAQENQGLLRTTREMLAGARVALMGRDESGRIEREFAIDESLDGLPPDNLEGLRAVLEAAFLDLARHAPN